MDRLRSACHSDAYARGSHHWQAEQNPRQESLSHGIRMAGVSPGRWAALVNPSQTDNQPAQAPLAAPSAKQQLGWPERPLLIGEFIRGVLDFFLGSDKGARPLRLLLINPRAACPAPLVRLSATPRPATECPGERSGVRASHARGFAPSTRSSSSTPVMRSPHGGQMISFIALPFLL